MDNLPASVRQRLLNLSRQQQRPFQQLLQFYVMERFLYRLSQSAQAERFVLKGALMLQVWEAPLSRPTMDIDMLGRTGNDPEALLDQVREILRTVPASDGIDFDLASLTAESISEDAEYKGVRVCAYASLAGARTRLQLDVGFGDVVLPPPTLMDYPVLLDMPAPQLLCYSRESAIAEKFQAMVSLGALNSRMKDFYDIWLLSRQFDFELAALQNAIRATFTQRRTALPAPPLFDEQFASEKQRQWQAFIRRLGREAVESDFGKVLTGLALFLSEAVDTTGKTEQEFWPAGGPWSPREDE